jgi:hypothetical protein
MAAPDERPRTALEPGERGPAVLIVGGLLTSPWEYLAMRRDLLAVGASRVWLAPVLGMHWLVGAFIGLGSAASVVAATIDALAKLDGRPILLIGHSAGGILARLATASARFEGARRASRDSVGALVTLGTPHRATRVDGRLGLHGRRALRFLGRHAASPDALPTLTVGSDFDVADDGGGGRAVRRVRAGLASATYYALRGHGPRPGRGDGMVPFETAFVPGSEQIRLEGIAHAPVVWLAPWYGSPEGIAQWWDAAVELWRAGSATGEPVVQGTEPEPEPKPVVRSAP